MAKLAKKAVNYRQALLGPLALRKCGNCTMFRPVPTTAGPVDFGKPGACTLVAGPIGYGHVCDRWAGRGY